MSQERHWSEAAAEAVGTTALAAGVGLSAAIAIGVPAGLVGMLLGGAAGFAAMRSLPSRTWSVGPIAAATLELPPLLTVEAAVQTQRARALRLVGAEETTEDFLSDAAAPMPADATDALHAALDDIRRVLRKG